MSHNKTLSEQIIDADLDSIFNSARTSLDLIAGKRVLLTGGAGFLGYTLVKLLCRIGQQDGRMPVHLVVCDNFTRGRKLWLDELVKCGRVILFEHDINKPLPETIPSFDYIIHAASIASPSFYRKFPIQTIDANVNGLRHLLDYALTQKKSNRPISGFLFFSSSEIYGDPSPNAIPTPEDYRGFVSCTGPRACYDESKRLGETLCVNFYREYGLPITIARPFNNYGPGLDIDDRRLLPDLARDVLAGKDIVLHSDGNATRTFCYISDAVSGYLKVLTFGRPGESYNIGTEAPEISVKALAEKVSEIGASLFGYSGIIKYKESDDAAYLTDNPVRRCPDISKAKIELGYSPLVDITEGLRRSMIWYEGNRS